MKTLRTEAAQRPFNPLEDVADSDSSLSETSYLHIPAPRSEHGLVPAKDGGTPVAKRNLKC